MAFLAEKERELALLEGQLAAARAQVETLRAELAATPASANPAVLSAPPPIAPATPEEKVALFRSLFRGREDVYPTRWTSAKTGKSGWSPACSNKFVRGICELPRVKCSECAHVDNAPVTDKVVLDHLQGRHTIGVYPFLPDGTCWFLAVDFDEANWRDDAGAFLETCARNRLPAAAERSRSGNGAHVWLFFSAPVSVINARKLGCFLLTETMARRHELSMESYDRLFPSQDTMPKGGFGNLIALPLQHEPRKSANTVFLDAKLLPLPDDQQWSFLAGIQRIAPSEVDRIAVEAARQGAVLGLRAAEAEPDEESAKPWQRSPSRRARQSQIDGPVPPVVRAVLAQRLFVEKAGLPSPLLNQIKRLAAFQNPDFYRRQAMRLSTSVTPRVIACFEEEPLHVGLPRGCRPELEELLAELGTKLEVEDRRVLGAQLDVEFEGTLTQVQETAARALLAHDLGVFVAPPGVGKTVVGTYLVAKRARSTLILVERRHLLDQWIEQLAMFLGLEHSAIGQIGAGKRRPNGLLDVATIQSLVRKHEVDDIVGSYGHVVVDECHHLPAVSFERLLSEVKARFVTGLTATPQRRDGHHPITDMQLGPVRFAVPAHGSTARRAFDQKLFVRETKFVLPGSEREPAIQQVYAALALDEQRNRLILDDVIACLASGRSPILLTERKDHLELFAENLRGFAKNLVVLQGGMGVRQRREAMDRLASIPKDEERLVLATGRYIGEGFDDPRLDTLFLALPVSWKGTLVQYTGRLHRNWTGKTEVQIYDYVDSRVPVLMRMFEKRLRGYRAIGYARGEAPLGLAEPPEEPTVQYDEEALLAAEAVDEYPQAPED